MPPIPCQVFPAGDWWLVSAEQQQFCQLTARLAKVHAQWVAVRTYCWVLPLPPVPQTCRRMLWHNAIKARDKTRHRLAALQSTGAAKGSHFLARADGPSSLPLTWVRVPSGALQNGTNFR